MRISAKGRYGLAAMVHLALNYSGGNPITIISISEKMGISKIYLEQVFALLKRGGLVLSLKGSQGGYQLAREPKLITAYHILSAIETSMMEPADKTVAETQPQLADDAQDRVRGVVREARPRHVEPDVQVRLADRLAEREADRLVHVVLFERLAPQVPETVPQFAAARVDRSQGSSHVLCGGGR